MSRPKPNSFLKVVIHRLTPLPGLTGVSVGYESGKWRDGEFADYLFEWLPDFALKYSEAEGINRANATKKLRDAFKNIYATRKFRNRGEFGELLLHALICEVFDTIPAVSKIFYKDSRNDTVKGVDAVHVVVTAGGLELWLGEAKFYSSITKAVKKGISEIKKYSTKKYLREEFAAITNKIDPTWPHSSALTKLLDSKTSLDEVFPVTCVPLLLTYDSSVVSGFKSANAQYEAAIRAEFEEHYSDFSSRLGRTKFRVHLFLVPVKSKKQFVEVLDKKLNVFKSI